MSDDASLMLEVRWVGEYLESPDAQMLERSADLPGQKWRGVFLGGSSLDGFRRTDVFEAGHSFREVSFFAG